MRDAAAEIQTAFAHFHGGDPIGAQRHCRLALAAEPNNFIAHLLLGAALNASGAHAEAIACLNKAQTLGQDNEDVYVNRGLARLALNELEPALADFTRCTEFAPNLAFAHFHRAQVLAALGRDLEAQITYRRAADLSLAQSRANPNNAQIAGEACIYCLAAGWFEGCVEAGDRATALAPGSPESWSNRGAAHMALGRTDKALTDFDEALRLRPAYPEAHCNRGAILCQLGAPNEALAAYEAALALRPAFPDALSGKGLALVQLGRLSEAHSVCEAAIQLAPQHADAWNNLGIVLLQLQNEAAAFDCFQNALRLNPNHADALFNRGTIYSLNKHFDFALADFERAREMKPIPQILGQMLHTSAQICDWAQFSKLQIAVTSELNQERSPIAPLHLMGVSDNPAHILLCARKALSHFETALSISGHAVREMSSRALRVGFVSADFRDHPCAVLLVPLVEKLDRARVNPIGINIGPRDDSAISLRISAAFDQFEDLAGRMDEDICEQMRALELDIAIDLMGHTRFSRPRIFFLRPAPIQVNFLGFPGTSGSSAVDYIIADEIVAPAGCEPFFAEALCRMPDCYLPTNPDLQFDPEPDVASLGLPKDSFIFASFNQSWKITPAAFDAWMRILARAPGSILWLAAASEITKHNLRKEAEIRGISGSRLYFADRIDSHAAHLARMGVADTFLDTWPYNAHSTACDALLAKLPLITLKGNSFASRVATSVLTAHGVPELAMNSVAAYEDLAVELYMDPGRLTEVRSKIANAIPASPLFDVESYTRSFEEALLQMVRRSQQGQRPEPFRVADFRGA